MFRIQEASRISGVSVRTLQYYDKIGLLKPARTTGAGYRLYDERCLHQLQEILLYKELEFSLKEIRVLMQSPEHERKRALRNQILLLERRREHLDSLLTFARNFIREGISSMDFTIFNAKQQTEYEAKAKEQWGNTAQFAEYQEKTKDYGADRHRVLASELMLIFSEFGAIRGAAPDSEAARKLTAKLQRFISEHYYRCDSNTLRGLGQLYKAGGELTDNINAAGGEGTAEFVAAAIEAFCLGK